ncbi:MAG: ABC transporter permease subunit [Acetobacter orientalis]|uniref:ABC transporter permease n=2 Tax=Acetobacter orientalis TaxID=146474 RepID=UPI0039EAE921
MITVAKELAPHKKTIGIFSFFKEKYAIIGFSSWFLVSLCSFFSLKEYNYPGTYFLIWSSLFFSLFLFLLPLLKFTHNNRIIKFVFLHIRWFAVLGFIIFFWEMVTAYAKILPLPFFPSPQAVLNIYLTDFFRLSESVLSSLLILIPGFFLGSFLGFFVGAAIGWSKEIHYWLHPVIRFAGPLPAIAWLPIALFIFPTIYTASVFLVVISTAFPVAILTASGVSAVETGYYDVARTLGGSPYFLLRHIALPSALPQVFVGLFMGLGASFAVLIVAEMVGAKAGLGWYMEWAQGWGAYANLYAVLCLMSVLFSTLISILFKVRNHVLNWQNDGVKW